MPKYAPIVIFVYNRLEHIQQSIHSLLKNDLAIQSDLIIYADAPKTPNDVQNVQHVREFCKGIKGFKSLQLIERSTNYGLAKSIISGVSEVLSNYESVIVLEDDLVVSPYFLDYMNQGLNLYAFDDKVASIHGYCYPFNQKIKDETFFLRGADCWGWATWRRAWNFFEKDGQKLLKQLKDKKLTHQFDLDGAYPYTKMLHNQIKKKNDSWAVRWHASAFLENMLTLYPSESLVQNIGNDGTGVHCSVTDSFSVEISIKPLQLQRIPIHENNQAREELKVFFKKERNLYSRILKKLQNTRFINFASLKS